MASDAARWIVGRSSDLNIHTRPKLISLADPSTKQPRQYLQNGQQIMEIQQLESEFSSFLVGRHVIREGSLYTFNTVDPLFFVLAQQTPEQKCSWQPIDQSLESIKVNVATDQLEHLYQTLCSDQTDNVTYYKFSPQKAMGWLTQKRERVYQTLLQQEEKRLSRKSKRSGGSVSASFNLPGKEQAPKAILQTKPLQDASYQILCAYLNKDWTEAFLKHAGISHDSVLSKPTKKVQTTAPTISTSLPEVTPPPKVAPARTVGNKRLAKVSTKGMASMSSFFTKKIKK